MRIEVMKKMLEALEWLWEDEPEGTLEREAIMSLRQSIEQLETH